MSETLKNLCDTNNNATVYVIDDDASICASLDCLFRSVGINVKTCPHPTDFLERYNPESPSCLLLDVRLRGTSGFVIQSVIRNLNIRIPIIFMTAHGDVEMSVKALKSGAFDFFLKPVRDQDLLDSASEALKEDNKRLNSERSQTALRNLYDTLTPREREVMASVVKGLANKQIAFELGVSEVTVKIHRSQSMKKMAARTVADLVLKAIELKTVEFSNISYVS